MRRERATGQRLHITSADALETVRALVAVQAQDARSCRLALRARGVGRVDEAGLCVTWAMRGTLHLVREEDLPWLHAVCAPAFLPRVLRRLAQLGVDEPERHRIEPPFTRSDVAGLSGQAVPALLAYGASRGWWVRSLDGVFRAVSIPEVDREAALRELGRRYLAAHAPADARDLARWAGIPLRDVRLPDVAPPPEEEIPPRLLPPFDPYLLGWRDRSFAVPEALAERVFPGGGMFRATATIGGEVVGTWSAPGGRVVLDVPDVAPFATEISEVQSFLQGHDPENTTGPPG